MGRDGDFQPPRLRGEHQRRPRRHPGHQLPNVRPVVQVRNPDRDHSERVIICLRCLPVHRHRRLMDKKALVVQAGIAAVILHSRRLFSPCRLVLLRSGFGGTNFQCPSRPGRGRILLDIHLLGLPEETACSRVPRSPRRVTFGLIQQLHRTYRRIAYLADTVEFDR